jgi:twitching motility protein PilT
LVIVTGITGSGKTTTLASMIDRINRERNEHIITIEDPIEFIHDPIKCVINQREVGTHTGSFLGALRGSLRQDPNIILVGELRDLDTISMAMTASETGHLILTSMHTGGAVQSIDRIIDVFPTNQQDQIRVQLADCLEMVISQTLLPTKDGKSRCLACEVMMATTAVRHLIREKKTFMLRAEMEMGTKYGMITLEKSLKQLVSAGKISSEIAEQWSTNNAVFDDSRRSSQAV